jgi:hypothetical protein
MLHCLWVVVPDGRSRNPVLSDTFGHDIIARSSGHSNPIHEKPEAFMASIHYGF